jgi:protein TonB
MTRVLPFRSPEGLQLERVLGITFALLAHAALFMVLMRPAEFNPPLVPEAVPTPQWKIVKHEEIRRDQHPDTVPVKPHTPQQTLVRRDEITPPVVSPQPTPVSTPYVPDPVAHASDTVTISPPPAESSLSPIVAPAPTYPREPLNEGITGTVELELLIGVDGRVLEARVVRSSGNRQLDSAARDTVLRQWRFQPATRDGVPVQALGRLPVVFSLDGR